MRVFAWSDLHVDYPENQRIVEQVSRVDHRDDLLLLAGDLSHDLDRISATLSALRNRFARVFFVPGNHDLWVRRGAVDDLLDSERKLERVLDLSEKLGVGTSPTRLSLPNGRQLWVVPLLSWYVLPQESDATLYVASSRRDLGLRGWADCYNVRWPDGRSIADDLMSRNKSGQIDLDSTNEVLTFTHFLPRRELLFSGSLPPPPPPASDRPIFNFSRVAGSTEIDRALRRLGSTTHVYGHQHRNRSREIDGVRYLAHSLGYPQERLAGHLAANSLRPRLVWST